MKHISVVLQTLVALCLSIPHCVSACKCTVTGAATKLHTPKTPNGFSVPWARCSVSKSDGLGSDADRLDWVKTAAEVTMNDDSGRGTENRCDGAEGTDRDFLAGGGL